MAGVRAFIATVGMELLALAPHTVDECKRVLQDGGVAASVQLFVPVFPITTGAPACNGSLCWDPGTATRNSFVLQGLFQPHRQAPLSYASTFMRFALHAPKQSAG